MIYFPDLVLFIFTPSVKPPAQTALSKSDFAALSEFRYQMRRFEHFSENAVQAEGITPLQYLLLLHVKGFPGREWATVGELAERLQAKQHGVVALVSRCEAGGLVERRANAEDRRRVEVHLLPAGEAILTHLAAIHRAELRALQGKFIVPHLP
jgi:DNA-binding MarR family transcriptional regulator